MVGKHFVKLPVQRLRRKWKNNTKTNKKKIHFGNMDWIEQVQDQV
jgi:hypothetical protein